MDPQLANALLFCLNSGFFSCQSIIAIWRKRLIPAGITKTGFLEYSFRKKVAQYTADHGMLDENIQRLGKWTQPIKMIKELG